MAASYECLKLDTVAQNHYNEILKTKCGATPWVLFTYKEEDQTTLSFLEEGATRNDFIANLNSEKVIFGLLRIADGNKSNNLKGKLILVYWRGSNSELNIREESQQHYEKDVDTVFSKCDGFIMIEHEDELDIKLRAILTGKDSKLNGGDKKNLLRDNSESGGKPRKKYSKSVKRKSQIKCRESIEEQPKLNTPTEKITFPEPDRIETPTEEVPVEIAEVTETKEESRLEQLLSNSINYANVEKMKVIIVGDCEVGKTHLLHTYVYGKSTKYRPMVTVGVDHLYRVVNTDINHPVKLELWDTSGEERYRALASVWYRHAMGAMVIFDLTKENSLNSVPNWLDSIKRYSDCKSFMLVGNKNDLVEERKVAEEEAKKFAEENDMLYAETSAKFGMHVDDAFKMMANELVSTKEKEPKIEIEQESLVIDLTKPVETHIKKKKEKCCHK